MSNKLKMIPLCQLRPSKANVRKTDRLAGVEEMAKNIKDKDLLENLVVQTVEGAKPSEITHEVVAGGRRFAALKLLAKRKKVARDYPVRCLVLGADESATEISLAENFLRAPVHPADQFEAFAELVHEGNSVDDIAARFGVTPTFVEQRLKLASISPRLIAEYRSGAMTLEQLTAFTLSDSHALQEEVWFERSYAEMPAHAIRQLLTRSQVDAADRRARFIGAKAYQEAGGAILRDLFDAEDEGYFSDSQLLDRLVFEKLEAAAESIRAEGWRWVEIYPDLDLAQLSRHGRASTVELQLSEADEARLSTLGERYDELVAALEEGEGAGSEELDQVSAEIAELESKKTAWPDEDKAAAGAIVSVGHDGLMEVHRGLLKSDPTARRAGNGHERRTTTGERGNGYSDAILVDLSAYRTAALRELVSGNPDVAMQALLHALADQLLYGGPSDSCLRLVASEVRLAHASQSVAESRAWLAFQARHETWLARLPERERLWSWVGEIEPQDRSSLLAHCLALTVDALHHRGNGSDRAGALNLALATGLDMRAWWRPTRENFLDRLSKNDILAAVSEGVSPQASWRLAGFKKERMAKEAEKLLAEGGWLPMPLRSPASSAESGLSQ